MENESKPARVEPFPDGDNYTVADACDVLRALSDRNVAQFRELCDYRAALRKIQDECEPHPRIGLADTIRRIAKRALGH